MANCTPSFSTQDIPIDQAICGLDCKGVEYQVDKVVASMADGKCTFSWEVTRKKTYADGEVVKTEFTGTKVIACEGEDRVIFYCDDNEDCPVFKLILKCGKDDGTRADRGDG